LTGNLSFEKFNDIFNNLDNNTYIYVIEYDEKIIASGTLLIEQKFIHGGGKVGHIEDVIVDQKIRGEGLGRKITNYLVEEAKKQGCYKTILNCSHKNIGFYEKFGFKNNEVEMRIDFI